MSRLSDRLASVAIFAASASVLALAMTPQAIAQAPEEATAEPEAAIERVDISGVQDNWGFSAESCGQAPWQFGADALRMGEIGAVCDFDPATIEESTNRYETLSIYDFSAECELEKQAFNSNFTLILNETGDTLWVFGSRALDRTLKRCSEFGEVENEGEGEEE